MKKFKEKSVYSSNTVIKMKMQQRGQRNHTV